ncbi:MAG: hypothetical protein KU37_07375 [Sulfuricurvum sp. PC08-66]|nr:MAG: hypothetical protein KU37_07375 [Sulfuricurvum sp. PC08-66]
MQTNQLPHYDRSVNTTGCCPKFNPEGWDGQTLHFENKPFVKAKAWSLMYMPLTLGSMMSRVQGRIEAQDVLDEDDYIVLSSDPSPFRSEHLFAVKAPIEGEENVRISGDYLTKVFEGDYTQMGKWYKAMDEYAKTQGKKVMKQHFFYTTCPKCAKAYGQNYVVGVAQVE